ncbi:MAG: TdeIII family type II restriction endonuclease [Candidatus Zixiibacteriota bacterium]
MGLSQTAEKNIKAQILNIVDNALKRRVEKEPFDIVEEGEKRPFLVALVPEEILKASKFERSFVTSLGQIGWEKIAHIIGEERKGIAKTNYKLTGEIHQAQLSTIQKIVYELEHRVGRDIRRRPNWKMEKKEVRESPKDKLVNVEVISDLFVKEKNGREFYFELKSSRPNADQSRVSKEKMLKIYAMKKDEPHEVYFALPDNPYRTKEEYDHPYPKRYFDMCDTTSVLMGKDFWDKLGGENTYEELLAIFIEVGKITKEKIRKEFLKS